MVTQELVAGYKVFEGLCSDELEKIIPICNVEIFNSGDIILEPDTRRLFLFIILEGKVNVQITIPWAETFESKHLITLKKGDVFGETCLLDNCRMIAHITAANNVSLIRINGKELTALLDNNKNMGYIMMRNIGTILAQKICDRDLRSRDKFY